jgi:hypothetical protein
MRLSMLLNPKRSEPLNRMVTLLPGEQGRSRRNPVGQLLDQRWAHGFYVTMTVSSGGSFVLPYVGCHYPRQPTQNSRPKFRFPLNQHNFLLLFLLPYSLLIGMKPWKVSSKLSSEIRSKKTHKISTTIVI